MNGESNEIFYRRADLQADKRLRSRDSNQNTTMLGKMVLFMVCKFYYNIECLSLKFCSKLSQKFQCLHPFHGQEHEICAVEVTVITELTYPWPL
jgi:hypothetical protein